MAERTRAEVKEFVLGRITQWLHQLDSLEDAGECVALDHLYGHIENNMMLYKEEAKALERRLEDECKFLHDHTYNENSSYILHIDSLSIYADAWALYCRPGTYMIIQ